MREGSGMVEFEQQYPERYFDVGIAEQHVITFSRWHGLRRVTPRCGDLFNLPTAVTTSLFTTLLYKIYRFFLPLIVRAWLALTDLLTQGHTIFRTCAACRI